MSGHSTHPSIDEVVPTRGATNRTRKNRNNSWIWINLNCPAPVDFGLVMGIFLSDCQHMLRQRPKTKSQPKGRRDTSLIHHGGELCCCCSDATWMFGMEACRALAQLNSSPGPAGNDVAKTRSCLPTGSSASQIGTSTARDNYPRQYRTWQPKTLQMVMPATVRTPESTCTKSLPEAGMSATNGAPIVGCP